MGSTNRYPDEIRRRAIEEVTQRGRRASAVAQDLGMTQTTVSTWVRQYRRDKGLEAGPTSEQLARIKELPAQIVKMDRQFIAGIGADRSDTAVVRAVVEMAHAMGRVCVAEGVETAAQFAVLRDLSVDAYQGWLFSRALPAADFRALLNRGPLLR